MPLKNMRRKRLRNEDSAQDESEGDHQVSSIQVHGLSDTRELAGVYGDAMEKLLSSTIGKVEEVSEQPPPKVREKRNVVRVSRRKVDTPPDVATTPVTGGETFRQTFADGEASELVHWRLRTAVREVLKIERLTTVQAAAWELVAAPMGDVLIRAETGSGKTLAYALPIIHRLVAGADQQPINRERGTLVMVLAPTRELVEQVEEVFAAIVRKTPFVVVGSLHGGEDRHKEKARLRRGLTVLIATPGRLLDHLRATSSFTHADLWDLVLDEADRLLDMGFEPAIRALASHLTPRKRTLVSATITSAVTRLSHFLLDSPTMVGDTEDVFGVPEGLRQHAVIVDAKHRLPALLGLLLSRLDAGAQRVIVFVSTSDSASLHFALLSRMRAPSHGGGRRGGEGGRKEKSGGNTRMARKRLVDAANAHLLADSSANPVTLSEDALMDEDDGNDDDDPLDDAGALFRCHIMRLHGNMSQTERSAVFSEFRTTPRGILFCTDVGARGLDIRGICWVVHYDPPTDVRGYVHRIGRTARIGATGDSVLFLAPTEQGVVDVLTASVKGPIAELPLPPLLGYLVKFMPRHAPNCRWSAAAAITRSACSAVRADNELQRLAAHAYQSYCRAYMSVPREMKPYFQPEALHHGHVLSSFGLDITPSQLKRTILSRDALREERARAVDGRRDASSTELSGLGWKMQRKAKDDAVERRAARKVARVTSKPITEFDA